MWVKTTSSDQNPRDVWLGDIMGEYYQRGETPNWYECDDGCLKANWKEPVAKELVENHKFERCDDEEEQTNESFDSDVPDVDPE